MIKKLSVSEFGLIGTFSDNCLQEQCQPILEDGHQEKVEKNRFIAALSREGLLKDSLFTKSLNFFAASTCFGYLNNSDSFMRAFSILLIFFLQACVPFGFYKNAYNSSVEYFNPKPFILTQAVIDLPYAMQLVHYNKSYAVMVLAYVDNEKKLSWVDSEGNSLTTIDGKIIASNGMDNDLEILNTPILSNIIQELVNREIDVILHTSLYRLSKPSTTYLEMEHRFSIDEIKQNTFQRIINQQEVTYSLIKEKIKVPAIRWEAINYYWVDELGTVLKSEQTLAPNLETFFLETLKDFKP